MERPRIDVAALERLDLLVRDDGNGVAVVGGDTGGLLRLLDARPSFLRLVREAAYAARTGDVLALRAALEPFDVEGDDHGN